MMRPALRRFALMIHVTTSVAWIGAIAAYLALAIAGLARGDPLTARATGLAMQLTGWFVVVPLCAASFVTGVIQSLGTPWGLLRHYWIAFKLLITAVSTALLLMHMGPTDRLAEAATAVTFDPDRLHGLQAQLLFEAAAALVALVTMMVLSVYKPQGQTPFAAPAVTASRPAGAVRS